MAISCVALVIWKTLPPRFVWSSQPWPLPQRVRPLQRMRAGSSAALLHPVRPPAPQINYGPQQDTTLHQRQHSAPSSHINAQSRATSGNIIETEACRNVWFTSAAKQGVLMCCHICNDLRFSSGFSIFCVGEASVCEGECPRIRDVQLSDYH